jgi:hypothetical protein
VSAERSPATDQAAELDELVSALGYDDHTEVGATDGGHDGPERPPGRPEPGELPPPAVTAGAPPLWPTDDAEAPAIWSAPAAGGSSGAPDATDPEFDRARTDGVPSSGGGPDDAEPPVGTGGDPQPGVLAGEPTGTRGALDVTARVDGTRPVREVLAPVEPAQDTAYEPSAVMVPAPAAVARPPRVRRRRVIRSRKVRRVVRHIDPWSVLTFSVLFHLCLFGALLLAGTLVWSAAVASGTIANIESFVRDLGDYETWEIQGEAVLRAGVIIAGMLTLASSILMVLLTVVFNLISDLIGGIRVTVVEEEVHRVPVTRGG